MEHWESSVLIDGVVIHEFYCRIPAPSTELPVASERAAPASSFGAIELAAAFGALVMQPFSLLSLGPAALGPVWALTQNAAIVAGVGPLAPLCSGIAGLASGIVTRAVATALACGLQTLSGVKQRLVFFFLVCVILCLGFLLLKCAAASPRAQACAQDALMRTDRGRARYMNLVCDERYAMAAAGW